MQCHLTVKDLIHSGSNLKVLKAPNDGRFVMNGHLKIREVTPGFWISYANCTANEQLDLTEDVIANFTFNLCLSGQRYFYIDGKQASLLQTKTIGSLVAPEGTNIGEVWQKGQKSKTVGLAFEHQFIDRLLEHDEELGESLKKLEKNKGRLQKHPASLELILIAQQIAQAPDQGSLSQLYYKGLGMAFIAEFIRRNTDSVLNDFNQDTNIRRKIIEFGNALNHAPMEQTDITGMARSIGISERRFRTEFFQQFGSSVTDYIRVLRLECAHEMLEDGKVSIDEIAYLCGYSNTPNFSNAFKRKFRYTPATARAL